MKYGIIIAAAGLSSRMRGGFKPLLPLGDKTIIEHVVDHAIEAEISRVVVVVGKNGDLLRQKLSERPVTVVENPDYDTTDMMTSIQLGLRHLPEDLDAFFVMPVDMPLITAQCYQEMMYCCLDQPPKTIVKAMYGSKGGHPILLGMDFREEILSYKGENGLKGVVSGPGCAVFRVYWKDRSVLMDADTPEEYERMVQFFETTRAAGQTNPFAILKQNKTPVKVIQHSVAVEQKALQLARKAIAKGYRLDMDLIHNAALLHDVERTRPKHAEAGARLLEQHGMPEEARIVREHMFLSEEAVQQMDERAIVFLADKLVCGTKEVTIGKRFEKKLELYRDQPEVYEKICRNMQWAGQIARNLYDYTPKPPATVEYE